MSHLSRSLGLCAATVALLVTVRASAAPEEEEEAARQKARELVYRGDDLTNEKRFGEALEAYREADELVHVPTTGVEVAKTLLALGRLTEARTIAKAVEALPVAPDEPLPFWEARQRATALIREVDRRLPAVRLDVVPAVKKRLVRVDKEVVSDGLAWSPIRMDPGRHIVTVEAPGFAPVSRTVDVVEGQRTTLTMQLPEQTRGPSPISITGFVVSGLALTGGIVSGAMYLKERGDLVDACAAHRAECGQDAYDRANAFGWAANIGLTIAVAGAALGTVTYVLDLKSDEKAKVTASVAPGFVIVGTEF